MILGYVPLPLVTVVKGASDDFEENVGGLRIIYLKSQTRARCWTLFAKDVYRLRKLIKHEHPDIIHAHGIEDAYALAIYQLKQSKVLTLWSLYEDYNAKNPVRWYSALRLIEYLEKR